MAIVLNDIIQIKDIQSFLGQLTLNVFMYRVVSLPVPIPPDSLEVTFLKSFRLHVAQRIAAEQHEGCEHTLLRLDNLTDGVSFGEYDPALSGSLIGDTAPSFNAFNFVLRRETALTRNGSKRMGGLAENSMTGNDVNISAARIADLETAMSDNLYNATPPGDPIAEPVIVGRTLVGTVYELDLTKLNNIVGATLTALSTQRTRKVGRGA